MKKGASFTCFFIGPMSTDEDMARLQRVANELLLPILKPLGYRVVFPHDPSGSADIFDFIMKQLDTADLLVADLSHDNPNVYYELSIRHSLGLPYALISQKPPRFDIAQLRCQTYKPDDLGNAETIALLKAYLRARHEDILGRKDVLNPITEFYGAPLAEVSPASGLSLGYYRNFIQYSMTDIRRDAEGILVAEQPVPHEQRKNIQLQVWIPDRLTGAFQTNIKGKLLESGRLHSAQITKKPRPTTLYALRDQSEFVTLVDIPTALNAMEYAIGKRYSAIRLDKGSEEWKKLEAQEIERFTDNLTRLHRNEDDLAIVENVSFHSWAIDSGAVTPRSKGP